MLYYKIIFFLIIASCQPSAGKLGQTDLKGTEPLQQLGYSKFKRFELPNYLNEISGLSFLNNSALLCHNDEEGEFYHFDLNSGQITNTTRFGSDDDYEGIAHSDDQVFVVRSSGHITTYSVPTQERIAVQNTTLNSTNNVEGLDLDTDGRLWMACKGAAGKDFKKSDRAIYTYDIASSEKDVELAFLVNENELEKHFGEDKVRFQPSGIALHPNGEQVYITSAFESRMLITDRQGNLQKYIKLNTDLLPQVEGIAIGSDGTLYLASEGRGGKGVILVCKRDD